MTKHGGSGHVYSNLNCRCDVCRAANTERLRRRRLERYAMDKDPNDPRHGSASFYSNWGCRCDACSAAYVVHNRKQYDARKARGGRKVNR